MSRRHLWMLVLAACALPAGTARAADPRHPDWPCHQIKVPELSLVAVWAGPPLDDVGNSWQDTPQVADLVARVTARRTPIEQAEKEIGDFLTGDPANREKNAKLLMAGVFTTLNTERDEVMNGIERFAKRRKELAEKIRAETRDIRALEDASSPDQPKIDDLSNTINWDTRIFEDQRQTIGYVCEVPVEIERRLGALARAIQQALD